MHSCVNRVAVRVSMPEARMSNIAAEPRGDRRIRRRVDDKGTSVPTPTAMSTHTSPATSPRVVLLGMAVTLLSPAVVAAQSEVEYYATDAVGSIRVVFDSNGTAVARSDYLPFGESYAASGAMPMARYTGQERDAEAGLDNFNARAFGARAGRFTRPDPADGDPKIPQTWNRYAYARNDALGFNDPSGMTEVKANPPSWWTSDMIAGGGAYYGSQYATRIGGPPADLASIGTMSGYNGSEELNSALALYGAKIAAAVSSVTILGAQVMINYAPRTSLDDMAAAGARLSAAAGLINDNSKKLTENERSAIEQVDSIRISASSGTRLGWIGAGSVSLSVQYLRERSDQWAASIIGHEGQHGLNARLGIYMGGDMYKDELRASETQMGIGLKVGFTRDEVRALRRWMADPARLQEHMEKGYQQP
jgi:RHS repeat-associated protein